MDFATFLGLGGFAGLIFVGVTTNQLPAVLLNTHGALFVVGGVTVAMLLNTPLRLLFNALGSLRALFTDSSNNKPEKIIPVLVALAEQYKLRGVGALREVEDARLAQGFLMRAATTASEYNDPKLVREVLEHEVSEWIDYENELVNVYRSMSVLAPMFGLIGTLIGIIGVLKDLSNPESVGPAMAIAITSAFYGIFMANMICVPIAGKLRLKIWSQTKIKFLVIEGISEILKGSIPIVVERKLQSYL